MLHFRTTFKRCSEWFLYVVSLTIKKGEAGSQGGDVMGSVSQSAYFMLLLALWTEHARLSYHLWIPAEELNCAAPSPWY